VVFKFFVKFAGLDRQLRERRIMLEEKTITVVQTALLQGV